MEDIKEFIDYALEKYDELLHRAKYHEKKLEEHLGDAKRVTSEISLGSMHDGVFSYYLNRECDSYIAENWDDYAQNGAPVYKRSLGLDMSVEMISEDYCLHIIKGHKVVCEVNTTNAGTIYKFTYNDEAKLEVESFLQELHEKVIMNTFYKGKTCIFTNGWLMLTEPSTTKMADVVLDEEQVEKVVNNTLFYLENTKRLNAADISARRGVLISGPPGNGKTMLCRALAHEAPEGTSVIWATAGSISRTDHVAALFKNARALSPSIVIFEDIDTIGQSRDFGGSSVGVGEMLTQMDGLEDGGEFILVATTNYPDIIDSALKDRPKRFDRHYEVELPSKENIVSMIKKNLNTNYFDTSELTDGVLGEVAVRMKGSSGAMVCELVQTAQVYAISNESKLLTKELLIDACKEVLKHQPAMQLPENLI